MKEILVKIERIGVGVSIIALLFKLVHWPGAGILLVVGMSTLAITFFMGAFIPRIESPDAAFRFSNRLLSFAMSIGVIGLMFSIQRWPGGNIQLIVGGFSCLVLSLFSFYRYKQSHEDFPRLPALLIQGAVISVLCLYLAFFR